MKGKGCLIAAGVGLGLVTIGLALVGPIVLREGERFYRPIAKMKGAQQDFDAWSAEHKFAEPAKVTVSPDQLVQFLKLRRRFEMLDEKNPFPVEGMRRNERPKLADIEGMLEGVGGAVSGRMDAYREVGMSADEYRYLERVVYRLWLRPLRAKGLDPAAVARVSKELNDLAASESDAAVASRLKRLAATISARRVPAPEGFPAEVHALLLAHAADIDALIDVGPSMPTRGSRRDPG